MEPPARTKRGRPPMPGRREEILDSAIQILAERGLEGLSIAQLAEALGLSTYALTYHFGSKEEVFAAVVERVETTLQDDLTSLFSTTSASLPELIRGYWETTTEPGANESVRLWLEIVLLASRDPERFPGFLDRAARDWTALIRRAMDDSPRADALAALAFATITGLEVLQVIDPNSKTPELAFDAFMSLFETLLAAE